MFRGVALALVLFEGVAWADDPLARARDAVGASDYMAARTELVAAREAGRCNPEETVELYQLSGIVEAALGNTEAATDAFARLLALSSTAALPPGTAPKITRLLETARLSFLDNASLELKVETAARPPAITVIVVSDPLRMVAATRVAYTVDGGPERTAEVPASPRAEIALPAGRRFAARVAALDEHGNRLVEIGSRDAPIAIVAEPPSTVVRADAPPPVRARAARRPIMLRWWPYAVATVASGVATAYFGWSAYDLALDLRRARSAMEIDRVTDRGRRATLLTNIGFGVTGAFALTAAVMFVIAPRRAEMPVTAIPASSGGAIVFGGRF